MAKKLHLYPIAAVLAATALAGCAAQVQKPVGEGEQALRAKFVCEGGTTLDVTFRDEKAWVTLADGSVFVLPQRPAASGYWYSSGMHELRGKGDEATWGVGRMVPLNCRAE